MRPPRSDLERAPAGAPLPSAGINWLWRLLARFEAKEERVATQQQRSHPEATIADDLRARNARALELVREWLADESGYDEKVFPVLKAGLEADRLSGPFGLSRLSRRPTGRPMGRWFSA